MPTVIGLMVSGPFRTACASSRKATRKSAALSNAIVEASTRKKLSAYPTNVSDVWKAALPESPMPGPAQSASLPAGGTEEVTGLKFRPPSRNTSAAAPKKRRACPCNAPGAWMPAKVGSPKEHLKECTVDGATAYGALTPKRCDFTPPQGRGTL